MKCEVKGASGMKIISANLISADSVFLACLFFEKLTL